jgi:hypothetical protein
MFFAILLATLASATLGVIVYAAGTVCYLKGVIAVTDEGAAHSWLMTVIDVTSAILLGSGVVLLASPAALYWWVHGDYDRYLWIIRGPSPYNQLGGGPFQLWTYVLLLILGLGGISVGLMLRRWFYIQLEALIKDKH